MSDTETRDEYWSTARHFYFRDHASPGWGVGDGKGGTGPVLITGLDKNIAAAIACLLNGDVGRAKAHLGPLPEKMP
jgi:hypothetical protein